MTDGIVVSVYLDLLDVFIAHSVIEDSQEKNIEVIVGEIFL